MRLIKLVVFLITCWNLAASTGFLAALTATRTRKAFCVLAATYAAHHAYSWWSHRAIAQHLLEKPNPIPLIRDQEPTVIVVHGIGDNQDIYKKYLGKNGFLPPSVIAFNFQDATEKNLGILMKEQWQKGSLPWESFRTVRNTSLGQQSDMDQLHTIVEQHKDKNIILFGISRGAATIINYLATYKPDNVSAAILESPYDSMRSVVNGLLSRCYLHYVPGLTTLGDLVCAGLFKQYSPYGIEPRDAIAAVPPHVKLLFIASEHDQLVPASSTLALYDKAREAKLPAELLVTQQGKHAEIIGENGKEYREFVRKHLPELSRITAHQALEPTGTYCHQNLQT